MNNLSNREYNSHVDEIGASNFAMVGELNQPVVTTGASISPYLDTSISANEIVPLSATPSGNYDYLSGGQSITTNATIPDKGLNCGAYMCSGELGQQ